MSWNRIRAVILQELYVTRHSLEVFFDTAFFPLMNLTVVGFFSTFLFSIENNAIAYYFFIGTLLWEVVHIAQYTMSVTSMWNIWSRNLSNMFITPLTLNEFIASQILSSTFKTILVFNGVSLIALVFFKFNIYSLGVLALIVYFINLIMFAFSSGLIILGLIFRFGNRIQAFSWGLIYLFQPLTAAFFPLDVLPPWVRVISMLFPPTWVFEDARQNLNYHWGIDLMSSSIAFAENLIYFSIAVWAFTWFFRKSKEIGQFARNEG